MIFCQCEDRKLDINAPLLQADSFIICPDCRSIVKCGECPKPAQYFDVFGEPKCAEHDCDFIV